MIEIQFDSTFSDLSSWRNGIRDIVVFQLSGYDQRNGIRVCTPFYQVKNSAIKLNFLCINAKTNNFGN